MVCQWGSCKRLLFWSTFICVELALTLHDQGVYVCSSMRYNKKSSAVKGNQQVGEVPNDFHGNRTANDMTVPYSTTKAPQAPLTSSDVV